MKRRVGNIVSLLSLVIAIAIGVLWGRSYERGDQICLSKMVTTGEETRWRRWVFSSGVGCMCVARMVEVWDFGDAAKGLKDYVKYIEDLDPQEPGDVLIHSGWVRSFAGFGVANDWQDSQPPETGLRMLPLMGRLFPKNPWTESYREVWVPHWFLILLFGAMPGRKIYRWQRSRRRRKRGLCEACGYDMRGSGEQCPECGRIISKSTGEAPVPQQQLGKT